MLRKNISKRNIIQSLSAMLLAVIVFLILPSLLPLGKEGMAECSVMLECRRHYQILLDGKVVAVCRDIADDSTFVRVDEPGDTHIDRQAMVAGCWMNRWSVVPYCCGRIATVLPFPDADTLSLNLARNNMRSFISHTVAKKERMLLDLRRKQPKTDYYLNTHSVVDDGYNTIAAYNEENRKLIGQLENEITLLKRLVGKSGITVERITSYSLLYSPDGKSVKRMACTILPDEQEASGTVWLQTADGFMPDGARAVYRFDVFNLSPNEGDTICSAGIFSLNPKSTEAIALQKPLVNKGTAKQHGLLDMPELLTPVGAPLFNRYGFFIGLNDKGRIAK